MRKSLPLLSGCLFLITFMCVCVCVLVSAGCRRRGSFCGPGGHRAAGGRAGACGQQSESARPASAVAYRSSGGRKQLCLSPRKCVCAHFFFSKLIYYCNNIYFYRIHIYFYLCACIYSRVCMCLFFLKAYFGDFVVFIIIIVYNYCTLLFLFIFVVLPHVILYH